VANKSGYIWELLRPSGKGLEKEKVCAAEIDGLSSLAIAIFSIGCGRPVEKYEMFDFSLENEI
jgi:hypothetical protein